MPVRTDRVSNNLTGIVYAAALRVLVALVAHLDRATVAKRDEVWFWGCHGATSLDVEL